MSDCLSCSITDYGESCHIMVDVRASELQTSTHYDRTTPALTKEIDAFHAAIGDDPTQASLRFGDEDFWLTLQFEAAEDVDLYGLVAKVEVRAVSFHAEIRAYTTAEQARRFADGLQDELKREEAFPALLQLLAC